MKLKTRKKAVLVKVDVVQLSQLNALAKATRVPRSVYIREGVDDLLKKYQKGKQP